MDYCDYQHALHWNASNGNYSKVQTLLNEGAPIDARDSRGHTPLMIATKKSHREVVELLIKSGADIHCCDFSGWTAMHFAALNATQAKIEIIQLLMKGGADFNVRNLAGMTPLYIAYLLMFPHINTVKHLFQAGADCNREDYYGRSFFSTLLSTITEVPDNVEIIKLCFQNGAYVDSIDYNNILRSTWLKKTILQDPKLCSQAVINKFNNRDLPLLHKGLSGIIRLPDIDKLKIVGGSEKALVVEQAIAYEIGAKGFCNVLEMVPPVLSMLCVNSYLKNAANVTSG